jgi:hypothetical protein
MVPEGLRDSAGHFPDRRPYFPGVWNPDAARTRFVPPRPEVLPKCLRREYTDKLNAGALAVHAQQESLNGSIERLHDSISVSAEAHCVTQKPMP